MKMDCFKCVVLLNLNWVDNDQMEALWTHVSALSTATCTFLLSKIKRRILLFLIIAKEGNAEFMALNQYIARGCITIYCITCSTLTSDQSILNSTPTANCDSLLTFLHVMCLCRSAPKAVTGDPEAMDGFPVRITEAVCLGTSLALSGICYYLYRKSRSTVDKLDVSCGSYVQQNFR